MRERLSLIVEAMAVHGCLRELPLRLALVVALLAERNLYMRRLVEVERFVRSAPPPTVDADSKLLGVVSAVLYGPAGSSPAGAPPAPG